MNFNSETGKVLLINKPLEWTSFDVVNKIRYACLTRLHKERKDESYKDVGKDEQQFVSPRPKIKIKVGHAGTLDPLATGLLIVCIGKETKNIDQYMATDKEYTGAFFLGATTPSYDRETEVNETFPTAHITDELIRETATKMTGEQMQLPPVYSAIKKDGKKLYESARAGETVEINPRPINIIEFEITGIELPLVHFRIVCSKGTYIRSIAFDFGKALNSGAYLHDLCRTRSGNYCLKDAMTVEACVEWINE